MEGIDTAMARGDVMQTFTIGLGHRLWTQVFTCNPLVRGSDRFEVLVRGLAVLLAVVSIPVAGAIGTSVHDARTRVYAEETLTRHEVVATAVADSVMVAQPRDALSTARAKWSVSGREHTGVVAWSGRAQIGDQQAIWVNDTGANVGPPSGLGRADGDAIAIAILVWFGVANACAALVYGVTCWLNRWRLAQWDRQIDDFRANDGRTNHQ
jgi:hypothetical protein